MIVEFGVEQQCLSRNAADVQTCAAKIRVFLDESRLQAQLAGANGGGVSGRAAADDGYVINGVRQSNAPLYRMRLRGMYKQMIVNDRSSKLGGDAILAP